MNPARNSKKNPVNDRAKHTPPDRARPASDADDRAALEGRLAQAQASIRARIKRIESEVGPGPKALWAGARKRPVATLLAAAAAGLLFGNLLFRRRRRSARPVHPPVPPGGPPPAPPSGPPTAAPTAAPGGSGGGGMRYLFWITLLQTGLGLFADAAADYFAGRSGGAQRIFKEKRSEPDREAGGETQKGPLHTEDGSPSS